ncbi:MAG: hypothetical protein Q8M77_06530 [Hydrogenophaga sp.]|uniref:hypothetical protein n=1 Tax=unclassified Hydrogenophaga TaxID=2610897 RepID=UPI00207BCC8B|nr:MULTISPECIES: hypothetical protein [unclassified Hydrogenophaga]MDP3251552.1 hypothetical protein [Hydrogenophaga sp.]MDZ4103894.1 hypothetical protein [Hydrogenophaga sp.]
MMIQIQILFGRLAALVVGADLLARGASRLVLSFGISQLVVVVSLTIVALGTSGPRLPVSLGTAMEGRTSIATGNVIGSNTFDSWVTLSFMLPLAAVTLVLDILQPAPPAVTCSP